MLASARTGHDSIGRVGNAAPRMMEVARITMPTFLYPQLASQSHILRNGCPLPGLLLSRDFPRPSHYLRMRQRTLNDQHGPSQYYMR